MLYPSESSRVATALLSFLCLSCFLAGLVLAVGPTPSALDERVATIGIRN